MKKIESQSNPAIRELRRSLEGPFRDRWVVEGRKLFLDALSSGVKFEQILITSETLKRSGLDVDRLEATSADVFVVSPAIMKSVSRLETPPGILGIASLPPQQERSLKRFAAYLFSIRDPGNLGTLVRSAEAAGCEFLACSPDCAEPRQPKVVRASMGSIFRVPVFKVSDSTEYLKRIQSLGTVLYALSTRHGMNLFELTPRYPAIIMIGGESQGLPEDCPHDASIVIPMAGKVESLNAAMAGTLCFYHFARKHGKS